MATRSLLQEPPYRSPFVDRTFKLTLTWMQFFNSLVSRGKVLLTDATADPPNLGSGATAQVTVSVPGAKAGDHASASFEAGDPGVVVLANVTADDTVTVTFWNVTGGAINLASGTIRVRVEAWQ